MARRKKKIETPEVVYSSVEVKVYQGDDLLSEEIAKNLLGWQEGTEEHPLEKGDRVYRVNGRDVLFSNNLTNRPFSPTLAKRYALEMLRGKWALNGQTLVVDSYGGCQNCQHRLAGLVIANEMAVEDPDKWGTDPIGIPAILVTGICPDNGVVDTIDTGKSRTLGDVFFRNHELEKLSPGKQKKVTAILGHALRLAWLRIGGKTVSSAPHFPHSEALDFLERHPKIRDAVKFIWELEGGSGDSGRYISTYLSLGYASGLCYLMSLLESDPTGYLDGKRPKYEPTKAHEFWTAFATSQDEPFATLRRLLNQKSQSGAADRDIVVAMVVNAFGGWINGEVEKDDNKKAARVIKPKMTKSAKGLPILAEIPLLGGLDIDWESFLLETEEEEEYDEEYDEEEYEDAA